MTLLSVFALTTAFTACSGGGDGATDAPDEPASEVISDGGSTAPDVNEDTTPVNDGGDTAESETTPDNLFGISDKLGTPPAGPN